MLRCGLERIFMNIGLVGVVIAIIGGVLYVSTKKSLKIIGLCLETLGYLLLVTFALQRLSIL